MRRRPRGGSPGRTLGSGASALLAGILASGFTPVATARPVLAAPTAPATASPVGRASPGPAAAAGESRRGPAARRIVVDAIGDSITAGYARSGDSQGRGAEMDPGGGYPVRLRSLLDDGVEVRARGAGGSTLATWTTAPHGTPAALEALLRALWPDLPPARHPPGPRQGALSWTLEVDRPDVVILLLGVNDLWTDALLGGPPDARGTAERVARAARDARASGTRVLVATLLPNERDPAGAIEETNRRLCELEPGCIRLDERFARAGGPALLGDEVHPSPEGHRVIAEAMADALVAAGVARRRAPQGDREPAALPVEPSSGPR